ncbi:MAG: hypothetical protein V1721_02520 [Pseudomonadota bacterium]
MNDNNAYIVQCTRENFDEVTCLVRIFGQILDIDQTNYCIKTFSLDGSMKKRIDEVGASFWQEPDYPIAKSVTGRSF